MNQEVCEILQEFNELFTDGNHLKQKIAHEETEMKYALMNLSHDLRTPITSLAGYTQLLQKENLNSKQKEYLEIISSRTQILRGLVEQLFTYSQVMEEQVMDLQEENITSILEESILMYYNEFENSQINLALKLEEQPVYAMIDKMALRRVFINIITNALKYAQDQMLIEQKGKEIIFQNKTDRIDSIDVEKIFDRFFTVAKHRSNGSMGLGLTIARKLINDMHGQIGAKKQEDNLIITITLP
jgi:signal transduction histidine kinase